MTQPPPEKPPSKKSSAPPIDYHSPTRIAASAGCFALAFVALLIASLYAGLAFLFFVGNGNSKPMLFLIGGLVLIITTAILAKKLGASAAIALLIAALCIFLLTLTLCSKFSVFG